MAYNFGKSSKKRLATLHPDLQKVLNEVIKIYDISIICGHRKERAQNKAFEDDKSTKKWPNSRHNSLPSEAVDIAPWNKGIDWDNVEEFFYMAGIVMMVAENLGIKLFWGGRFKSIKDCPHFQLKRK